MSEIRAKEMNRKSRAALGKKAVEIVEDIRSRGTRKDASVTQRARAPFHAPLKPSNKLAGCELFCGTVDDLTVAHVVVGQLAIVQNRFDLMTLVAGSKKR